jgi:hypothetical protein
MLPATSVLGALGAVPYTISTPAGWAGFGGGGGRVPDEDGVGGGGGGQNGEQDVKSAIPV